MNLPDFLSQLDPGQWVGIVAASWLILACVVSVPVGRAIRGPQQQPEPVAVIRVLPPVPPTRSELAWLREQPAELLRGVDLRARFDDVIDSARRAEENAR